jgi:hypothetical protein
MADWYPNASRSQTYSTSDGRKYTSGYAKKGCLHTTEGTSWPGYDGGSMAPHFTIQPLTGDVRQHYPISYPSKALYQPSSPPTNKGGAIQIEIIGTCDPSKKGKSNWNFIPGQTSEQLKGLAELMRWIEANVGVSRNSSVTFRAYPSSYGAPTGRLSSSNWKTYNGWCGHQHVPSNNHGDPGNINIASLLGSTPPPKPPEPKPEPEIEEEDMPVLWISDGTGPDATIYAAPLDMSYKVPVDKYSYDAINKAVKEAGFGVDGKWVYIRVDVSTALLAAIPLIQTGAIYLTADGDPKTYLAPPDLSHKIWITEGTSKAALDATKVTGKGRYDEVKVTKTMLDSIPTIGG